MLFCLEKNNDGNSDCYIIKLFRSIFVNLNKCFFFLKSPVMFLELLYFWDWWNVLGGQWNYVLWMEGNGCSSLPAQIMAGTVGLNWRKERGCWMQSSVKRQQRQMSKHK